MSESQLVPVAINQNTDLLWDPNGFAHGQRIAKMFAESALIPQHLRGKVADVTIALLMAKRLGEDPLVVMQSIYIVSGKAGWSAQYMISRANRSGVFRGRINWRIAGTGKDLNVTAFATFADTGEEVSISAGMAMAQAEGWTSNKKYQSMPEVMLRYRSATLLIRMYCPEVMLGFSTVEELETMPREPGVVIQPQRQTAAVRAIADAGRASMEIPTSERVASENEAEAGAGAVEQERNEEADAEEEQTRAPRRANAADIARTIEAAKTFRLTIKDLEAHVQRSAENWTPDDLSALSQLMRDSRAKSKPVATDDEGA